MIKFHVDERPLRNESSMFLHLGRIRAFFSDFRRKGTRRSQTGEARKRRGMVPTSPIHSASFTSLLMPGGVRQFSARGEHPRLTQLLLDAVRAISGSLGVAIVELGESPREWVGSGVSRAEALEAILALRDLLGRGSLDLAIFSSTEGVEIYLDRRGLLEIRTGGTWEPRARSLLMAQKFVWAPKLPPPAYPEVPNPGARDRIGAVAEFLGLRVTPAPYRAHKS
jgi:hypothetical protein